MIAMDSESMSRMILMSMIAPSQLPTYFVAMSSSGLAELAQAPLLIAASP